MVQDDSLADLAAFGVLQESLPEKKSTAFEVWPENVAAVRVFLRCCTQWRASMGGLLGLDYTAMFEVMKIYGIDDIKDTFEGVQIIEGAVLAKLNERKGD